MKISDMESKVNIISLIDNSKLKKIKDGGYHVNPCPVCGHKDHFTIYSDTNSYVSYSGCCNGGSVYKYLQEVNGLSESQAYKKLQELAGNSETVVSPKKAKPAEEISKESDYTAKINELYSKQDTDDWEYFFSRKIPLSLIEKYKLSIEHTPAGKRAVLPIWKNGKVIFYTSRAIDGQEPKYKNAYGSSYLFNEDLIQTAEPGDTIFVTEGIFDALSIEKFGYNAIALGGLQHHEKLTKLIDETKCSATFVTVFDNDEEKNGKKAGAEMRKRLGFKYLPIPEQFKDINEWLIKEEDEDTIMRAVEKFTSKSCRPDSIANYLKTLFSADQAVYRKYRERKTGFSQVDKNLDGFQAGLYVIGGTSSVGKTTFIHQLTDQLAQKGEHILYFSLEQSKFELVSKSLARLTAIQDPDNNLTASEIKGGSLNDMFQINALKNANSTFLKFADNISIIEGNCKTTAGTVRDYIKKYIHNNKVKPVVVIDYLQILHSSDPRLNDKQKADANITELKRISRDLEISVIGISALNRGNYMTPVDFESFKESGGIEYTADFLWGLQLSVLNDNLFNSSGDIKEKREKIKDAKLANPRQIEFVSLKARNGISNFSCSFDYYTTNDLFEEI